MKRALVILTIALCSLSAARAAVDLTLYDSFPILDSNGTTPLEGTAADGDLVQLILAGPNGVIDPPTVTGTPGGDDTVLFTTHIEFGLTTTNTGHLVQSGILYPDIFGGNTNAFVRFWNSNTTANADFYGNSSMFTLPSGDAFGLAEYDFASLSGSARTTDNAFSFGGASAVPEPSNLFLLGLLGLGARALWKRRRAGQWFAFVLLIIAASARAQLSAPLDVTASAPILDANGQLLAGNNPAADSPVPGALVQIISVGGNGVADLPNLDGTPGGDDSIVATTAIGQGIAPNVSVSGRFSTSFYPPPTGKVFARVFDSTTVAGATHYGQSATFTPHNSDVFDLSALGVSAARQPLGSDPTVTDTDGDGQTDFQELTANTNPLDARDRLDVDTFSVKPGTAVNIAGRAGRQYTLERNTGNLANANDWSPISTTSVLSADQNLVISDPSPPNALKIFYRIRVTMP